MSAFNNILQYSNSSLICVLSLLDSDYQPVTGLTVKFSIKRGSNYWSNGTNSFSSATEVLNTATEDNGNYYYLLSGSTPETDEIYIIHVEATDTVDGDYADFITRETPPALLDSSNIAADVWDEARSGHVTAGTFGEYVNVSDSAIAEAVWDSLRASHVVSGSFGENVNSNLVKIAGSATVDGSITVQQMFIDFIAALRGAVDRSSNTYSYKNQAGTVVFSYTVSSGGRS